MKVVSLFAGCGGLDLGFEQAGFHVIWANENDQSLRDTYVMNHPNTILEICDIAKITPLQVPDCDGFIGGPPCQSWSIAGRQRGLEDERGQLFLTYIELIKAKKPKFFLIENVKGLLDGMFQYVFIMFLEELSSAGYDVKWQLIDAADYGVPQNRDRVFIIGFRNDLNISYEFPCPTHNEPVTLAQALSGITQEPTFYNQHDKVKQNTVLSNHDVIASPFGQFYYRGNRRRSWQQPSFTIHATADNIPLHPSSPKMVFFGRGQWEFSWGMKEKYRRLSVRECARIQTFPDSFQVITENICTAYKMIGNAVPPLLGKTLALSIKAALANITSDDIASKKVEIGTSRVLVGYYKNSTHRDLILRNKIYYVRSDNRKGSLFKEDCDVIPKYILIHHKDNAELYEIEPEDPVLADASFLRNLGFEVSGQTYLCFQLKSSEQKDIEELIGHPVSFNYDCRNYAPYFTTIQQVTKM